MFYYGNRIKIANGQTAFPACIFLEIDYPTIMINYSGDFISVADHSTDEAEEEYENQEEEEVDAERKEQNIRD